MERYYSYSRFIKENFGEKLYKICIVGGFTCPNRDGTLATGGCIFCSEGGSGEFTENASLSVSEQIHLGKSQTSRKYQGEHYIAYFQAFTNTYAPVDRLRALYEEAITAPEIVALSIGTRPDCITPEILDLLEELNKRKPVFIEMGLQTSHDSTASFLNRAYPTETFTKTCHALAEAGIRVTAHIILGLPGETLDMELDTIRYLNTLPVSGIKISMLYVLKNTVLASYYEQHPFHILTMEEYINHLIICLSQLRKDIVIERMTGDGPKDLLIVPKWIGHKRLVLNTIHKEMNFPLTNSQLSEFFVNHGYTSYFHLQQAINELVESEFVRAETIRNTTNYHLISSGKEALSMFHTQISEPIKNDILDYFAEKKYQLRKEVDITADYYPLKKKRGEYMVKTQIKEKGSLLLELNINVVSKEQAIAICDSWEKKSDAVYGKLMEMLLLDE